MLNADGGKRAERQNLMGNIWPSITNVSIHLSQDPDVLIAVEERVLVLPMETCTTGATVRGLVCFEAGIGEDDNQPL